MMERDNSSGTEEISSTSTTATNGRDANGREAGPIVRLFVILLVLAGGIAVTAGLVMFKKPPAEAEAVAPSLTVEATVVSLEDVPVTVTGLGEVRALNVVSVSPEIAGTIVAINPRLEMGEVIPQGELLFQIDQRDYQAAKSQAEAQVAQLTQTVERLTRQLAIDQSRLKNLDRNQVLMQSEFDRTRDLFEKDDVGTRSAVDRAEMSLNQTADSRDQLAQLVTLYPVQIQEAKSGLEGARAQLTLAEANLSRTVVHAPFDARIKQVNLEVGQFVSPGAPVLTLADDKILELSISLDSRDAKSWLQFDPNETLRTASWFGDLENVTCRISWTEDPTHHNWEGKVHRIESFDQQNRTIILAVRVEGEAARQSPGGLPLVEGMFCSVEIPGKTMEQVFRVPRWAVTYEGDTYVIRDGKLAIQPVEVVRTEGEDTFVRGGLQPGEQVITTRLINPLPNTAVRIDVPEAEAS